MRCLDEIVDVRLDTTIEGQTGTPPHGDEGELSGPAQFVWRGRLYVIRAVVGHWRERRAWWRDLVDGSRATGSEMGAPAEGDPLAPEALEHEVWRVEASAGRLAARGVYDLRHSAGRWHLIRLAD